MRSAIKTIIDGALSFPDYGRGFVAVWIRNYRAFRHTLVQSVLWMVLEPLVYLFAIGFGFGSLVPSVGEQTYLAFFMPGLAVTSAMLMAFFESTYGTYNRLTKQRVFEIQLLSPVTPSEISLGEILWATTKGTLSGVMVLFFGVILKLIYLDELLLMLPIVALLSWMFASFGVYTSSIAREFNTFISIQTIFIVPMALICDTFFPKEQMPNWLEKIVSILPLTQGTNAMRKVLSGQIDPSFFFSVGLMFCIAILLTNLSAQSLKDRLQGLS